MNDDHPDYEYGLAERLMVEDEKLIDALNRLMNRH